MTPLTKTRLLNVIENAIRDSGWGLLHLSPDGAHPADYQFFRGSQSHGVRVYIWNLSPGRVNRPTDEWRIQATGVDQFELNPSGKTLILGWQDDWKIFAGFDVTRHQAILGSSPSIQIREDALHRAMTDHFAPHNKGNGELAIAFRSDFLTSYVDNIESLHECGQIAGEVEVLRRMGHRPADVEDSEIENTIAESRRYAVLSTKRAVRSADFRSRVLTAYSRSCAMCGLQLRLPDGAHILPAAHPASTDGTENGVALCPTHHRAFDRAFVTFDSEFRIHVNQQEVAELRADRLAGGLDAFERALRPVLALPPDTRDRPAEQFVNMANKLRGWVIEQGSVSTARGRPPQA